MPHSKAFDRALHEVLGIEGGYSNHEADSGGRTRFGITEALARQYGYRGAMNELPKRHAVSIYHEHFWRHMRLGRIYQAAPRVAMQLFDAGVNIGRREVWRWLQRCLNVLNRGAGDYADIAEDGYPGPETMSAFDAYMQHRPDSGETVLARMIDCLQGHHYIQLAERRPKDEAFLFGWIKQRIS